MDHQLENLGPERFQHLAQALLAAEYSNVTCYPVAQPDGGRDAIQSFPNDGQERDFIVYQIKYSRHPNDIVDVTEWLLEKIDGEATKIKRLIAKGLTSYVLITNVSGTSHLDVGSIDKALKRLADEFDVPVHVWWRDDLNRRLDGNWDIKLRYSEILSGHDFFRLLLESSGGQDRERRMNAMRAFLAGQYDEDVEVKFKQVELNTKLLDLFIDLPFRLTVPVSLFRQPGFPAEMAINASLGDGQKDVVLSNANEQNSLAGTATLLLSEFGHGHLRQVVIEGAPGQGKSTLAQYLCQVHRIRILQKELDLAKLPDQDKQSPLRLPFKVDLRDLASWLGGIDPFIIDGSSVVESKSLETFIARLVRHNSGGHDFNVHDLIEVSKTIPLLIVLDGLDEVVDIKQRSEVVAAVTKAMPRLRENCPDLGVVVTSRPAAFANSPGFDLSHFIYIDLLSVKRSQIDKYADRWMDVRGLDAKERAEFQQILKEKLDAPHLRDLARNPMQLTILLSLILTQGAALPDKRTSLYDAYVDLFFSRESSKSSTVRRHIDLLKDLHRYIGWVLHSTAETNRRRSSGRISSAELKELLGEYLARERHPTDVIDELFGAMLSRVVMIVPRIEGTYEFEVQPLREYFAARYLYDTASYSPPGREKKGTKPDRFDAIARNFYWLNVVRYFCGCFSKGELLDLADRVKELIADPVLGKSRHSVNLAAMLLSDWVFAQSPKAVQELMSVLTTDDSLRRLATHSDLHSGRTVIQLPVRSGAQEIFSAAFGRLENSQLQPDQMRKMSQIVMIHGSEEQIDSRWSQSSLAGSDTVRWLRIGSMLKSLGRVEKDVLLPRIESVPFRRVIPILYASGRHDCILSSETNSSALLNYFLSMRAAAPQSSIGEWPFYLIPLLIGGDAYMHFALSRARPVIAVALGRFVEMRRLGNKPNASDPELVHQCYALSERIAEGAGEGAEFVIALLEDCRKLWGARPAVLLAAMRVALFYKLPKPKADHFSLLNIDVPMVYRARAARSKKADVVWWRQQLVAAGECPFSTRLFAYGACFTTLTNGAVLQLADLLGPQLDNLNQEEWATTASFLEMQIDHISLGARQSDAGAIELPPIDSSRLAYLYGLKGGRSVARKVFLKHYLSSADVTPQIAEFRQIFAVEAVLAGELDWKIGSEIVKQTYTQGAAYGAFRALNLPKGLPEIIVKDILDNPELFPTAVWDVAENSAAAKARKAIRAIGRVAKNDKWFLQ